MKKRFDWKGERLSPGTALVVVGFCAGAVLISGVILLNEGASLVSVGVWLFASYFLAQVAMALWRTRTGQSDGPESEGTE